MRLVLVALLFVLPEFIAKMHKYKIMAIKWVRINFVELNDAINALK